MVPISMVTNLRESFVEENSEEDQVWIKIVVGIDQIIFFFFPKHRNQVSIIIYRNMSIQLFYVLC